MSLDYKLKNLLKSASKEYRKKNYEAALRQYKSVFYQTRAPELMYKLAMCYKKKKEYANSLQYFNRLEKYPKFLYRSVYHQAHIYYEKDEYESAIKFFDTVFKLNKRPSHKIHTRKGVCLYNLKRYKPALKHFEIALETKKDPSYFYNKACILYHLKRYDEALDDASSALQLYKDHKNAYRLIGNIFYSKRQFKKAIDFLTKTELLKEDNDVQDFIADMHAERRDYMSAIKGYFELYEKNYYSKKLVTKIMRCFTAMKNEDMRNICVSVLANQITREEFKVLIEEHLQKFKPTEKDYEQLWNWMKNNLS